MASAQLIGMLQQAVQALRQVDFEKAARIDFGSKGLPGLKSLLVQLSEQITAIESVKHQLSNSMLKNIVEGIAKITNNANELGRLEDSAFFANKERIMREIDAGYDRVLDSWAAVVALTINSTTDATGYRRLMEEAVTKANEAASQQIEKLKGSLGDQISQLKDANEALRSGTIIKQEDIFLKEADLFRDRAGRWVWVVIGLSVLFIVVLIVLLKHFCFELSCYAQVGAIDYDKICDGCNRAVLYVEIGKAIAYRVLLISFLLFLIGISVRNYFAAMHNYAVNKHKANSLAAALAMINIKLSDKGQDDLMFMAASAIFSHQSTGYNRKAPDNLIMRASDLLRESPGNKKG